MSDNTVIQARNLLSANHEWAKYFTRRYPNFFRDSAKNPQIPNALWIGCADSRVPESVITASNPGVIFGQRNIANQFHLDDRNALSVLAYAVDSLKVQHVIVVGHSLCGGVQAALTAAQTQNSDPAPHNESLNRWLEPLTSLARSMGLRDNPQSLEILTEANIRKQVENLTRTETIVNAWSRWQSVYIHGWIYELGTGFLRDLNISRAPPLPSGIYTITSKATMFPVGCKYNTDSPPNSGKVPVIVLPSNFNPPKWVIQSLHGGNYLMKIGDAYAVVFEELVFASLNETVWKIIQQPDQGMNTYSIALAEKPSDGLTVPRLPHDREATRQIAIQTLNVPPSDHQLFVINPLQT